MGEFIVLVLVYGMWVIFNAYSCYLDALKLADKGIDFTVYDLFMVAAVSLIPVVNIMFGVYIICVLIEEAWKKSNMGDIWNKFINTPLIVGEKNG